MYDRAVERTLHVAAGGSSERPRQRRHRALIDVAAALRQDREDSKLAASSAYG